MIGKVVQRREERTAAIVAAAWGLARAHGVGALSLHALAREVGVRQPSLYVYFDSKHAATVSCARGSTRWTCRPIRGPR